MMASVIGLYLSGTSDGNGTRYQICILSFVRREARAGSRSTVQIKITRP